MGDVPHQAVFRPSDLATRWGVSANTVRAEIERGALSAFRIGKLYRIKREAVEEYECRLSWRPPQNPSNSGNLGLRSAAAAICRASAGCVPSAVPLAGHLPSAVPPSPA